MRTKVMLVLLGVLLLVQGCERKGGNPPRPVTSALERIVQVCG